MNNFELYNPTNYIFGKGQMAKLSQLIPTNKKIMLLYGGGSIFKNGVHQQVTDALKTHTVVEFGGIEPNPRYETLMKAVEKIRAEKIDFLLAIGGGSVIDGVKFISAAVYFEGEPINILRNRILFKDATKVMPFGTVLTLPATGSEMNSGAVITIDATQEKLTLGGAALFPQFSICDPTVVASLPLRQLQNGVIDAYVHVMEQYLTYPHHAYLQDRFSESILQTLIEIGPKVAANPADYDLAANFMWCCTMALNGMIQKGVPSDWATHMIGHELTALYEIDHARTLAIIAPNLYTVMFAEKQEKLAQYGKRVWGINGNDTDVIAREAIEKTAEFFKTMGMPARIQDATPDSSGIVDTIVDRFMARGWVGLGETKAVTIEKVRAIVEKAV